MVCSYMRYTNESCLEKDYVKMAFTPKSNLRIEQNNSIKIVMH